MKGEISFEQYGNLPEDMKIGERVIKMRESIDYYMEKDPESKSSIIKAVFATNYHFFALITAVRFTLCVMEVAIPILLTEFTKYMEGDNLPEYMTQMWAFKIAMGLLLLKVFKHTVWENICYKMILCGHYAHGALKGVIFEKTFHMSTASNKDYS